MHVSSPRVVVGHHPRGGGGEHESTHPKFGCFECSGRCGSRCASGGRRGRRRCVGGAMVVVVWQVVVDVLVVVSDTRRWWMSVMSDLISKKIKIKKDALASSMVVPLPGYLNPIVFTLGMQHIQQRTILW